MSHFQQIPQILQTTTLSRSKRQFRIIIIAIISFQAPPARVWLRDKRRPPVRYSILRLGDGGTGSGTPEALPAAAALVLPVARREEGRE